MDMAAATTEFPSGPRIVPPDYPRADVALAAPPSLPRTEPRALLVRSLPVLMAVVMVGVTAVLYRSGSIRSPTFLVFPAMMLASAVATLAGRASRGAGLDSDRVDYLAYLRSLRATVNKTAAVQHFSLTWCHPEPAVLWGLVGTKRMWERCATDSDFLQVRIGVATLRLATRLVPPHIESKSRSDPVILNALRVFLRTHSTIPDAPIAVDLQDLDKITIAGDRDRARSLVRAMVCQLAVLHRPDQVWVVGAVSDDNRSHWEWLKWLPHNQHPHQTDRAGPARMVYPSLADATSALADCRPAHVLIIVDGEGRSGDRAGGHRLGVTVLAIVGEQANSAAGLCLRLDGEGLTTAADGGGRVFARPDGLTPAEALVCARRLARYRADRPGAGFAGWAELAGLGDPAVFDPQALWRRRPHRDRLRVPIGTTAAGDAVELDIKEAAENGMGPHGLCIGATGSGKSELLRTVTLGMLARHSPEELNLVLVDFKGGATFAGLERARHVAAMITNLADAAHLVSRMRDALAGEMNRRQEVLRAAGNFDSVTAYAEARRMGAPLAALPALFVVVDEFSELLHQQPDLADLFVAIGRLGRSLGMHLLLASQRLDEGRLGGLESHLSYRLCLKTLTAHESRAVIGVTDAHELPNTPGAAVLRLCDSQLIRFQTAFVSGPVDTGGPDPGPGVRAFTAAPAGRVSTVTPGATPGRPSVLQTVLDRLAGHGPQARPVWLAPLETSPTLDSLLERVTPAAALRVPIGIVDRPFEQRRTPLVVDLSGAAGNVAVVGGPQSGKSTALCTLVTALAATHDPGQVQVYGLDFGGGLLAATAALPHVGSLACRTQPELVGRTIAHLEGVVESREARFRESGIGSIAHYRRLRIEQDPAAGSDRYGDVFLVIDGWAGLCHSYDGLEEPIVALARRGLSFGVHVVVSASRWAEIRPALRDQLGTRIELRLGEPADSELDRRRAQLVPRDVPGRGLHHDGSQMALALPDIERVNPADRRAPPVPLLPASVDHQELIERADIGPGKRILLGLDERRLQPVELDFDQGDHLLVFGDRSAGKTAALRTVCREIIRTQTPDRARLLLLDCRRGLLGVVGPDRLAGYAMSAAVWTTLLPALLDRLQRRMPPPDVSVSELRTRSWWTGPELYLVIDDYDLVAATAGDSLAEIARWLPHSADVGLHLVIARRSAGAARAMFEPLLAGVRESGGAVLVLSSDPDEPPLPGAARPQRLPPGRGTLVTRADGERLIQVAWSPPP